MSWLNWAVIALIAASPILAWLGGIALFVAKGELWLMGVGIILTGIKGK